LKGREKRWETKLPFAPIWHVMAESIGAAFFVKNALRLAVLQKQDYFCADVVVLFRDIAVAVIGAHASLGASIFLTAVRQLIDHP